MSIADSSYSPPPQIPPPPRSWWSRNWLWVIPAGCLGMLLIAGGFVALIVMIVMGAMRSSAVYVTAIQRAGQDHRVVERLGSPLRAGWFTSGNIEVKNDSGKANLDIPISGPKGKGHLLVHATKESGRWKYHVLRVVPEGEGEPIDLIEDEKPPADAAPGDNSTPEDAPVEEPSPGKSTSSDV